MDSLIHAGPNNGFAAVSNQITQNLENLLRPEVQTLLSADAQIALQDALAQGVSMVFWVTLLASVLCLFSSLMLPGQKNTNQKPADHHQ
jgi:hypothetical protein